MAHGFPLNPLKPWKERIRCVRIPPELHEILLTQRGSKLQPFYLGLACSNYGNRDHFCLSDKFSIWHRFRPSAMARIRVVRPEPFPIRLRVRVYNCEILDVPRGAR